MFVLRAHGTAVIQCYYTFIRQVHCAATGLVYTKTFQTTSVNPIISMTVCSCARVIFWRCRDRIYWEPSRTVAFNVYTDIRIQFSAIVLYKFLFYNHIKLDPYFNALNTYNCPLYYFKMCSDCSRPPSHYCNWCRSYNNNTSKRRTVPWRNHFKKLKINIYDCFQRYLINFIELRKYS